MCDQPQVVEKRTAKGTEQPGKRNFTYRRAPTNALRPPPSLPRTLRSRAVCFRLLEHTGRLPTQNAPCRYGPHLPETVPSPSARNHAAALSGRLYLRRDRQTAQGDLLPFYRNDTSPFHDGPPSQRHDKNGGSPGTPQRPLPFCSIFFKYYFNVAQNRLPPPPCVSPHLILPRRNGFSPGTSPASSEKHVGPVVPSPRFFSGQHLRRRHAWKILRAKLKKKA